MVHESKSLGPGLRVRLGIVQRQGLRLGVGLSFKLLMLAGSPRPAVTVTRRRRRDIMTLNPGNADRRLWPGAGRQTRVRLGLRPAAVRVGTRL